MLLERVDAPIPAVLERMGGLQAQYAPSIYLGLWSRVRGLERAAVTHALEERAIVQGTLLRRTIHAVSRADYWPFARGPREERPPDTPAPVRFLPTHDATLLVHARRALILPEEHRPRVFHTRLPQSVPTFLVDGAVAGSWRFADGRVELEPFEPLEDDIRRAVDDEAERRTAFHA
jgi:winged helix DNA-binding protein